VPGKVRVPAILVTVLLLVTVLELLLNHACSVPTLSIQDRDQRLKRHQELVGGVLGDKLQLLSKLVVSAAAGCRLYHTLTACRLLQLKQSKSVRLTLPV